MGPSMSKSNHPLALKERWKSVGKALEKRWKSVGKALEKRWKSVGKALEKRWKSIEGRETELVFAGGGRLSMSD